MHIDRDKSPELQPKAHHSPTLRIDEFAAWLRSNGVSANTTRAYLSRLRNFRSFQSSLAPEIAGCLNESVRCYMEHLQARNITPASRRGFCVALTSYCKFAQEKCPTIHVKSIALPVKVLSAAQQQQVLGGLVSHCSLRDRAMLGAMLVMGLRTGECVRADVNDIIVDGENLALSVRKEDGGIDRVVPITAAARQLLSGWVLVRRRMVNLQTDALFISLNGDRIHANTVRWSVTRLATLLHLDLNPQILRNTFVARIAGEVDIETMTALAGISSVSRISQYAHAHSMTTDVSTVAYRVETNY
jgi:site-specific recombinase XerD